MQLKTILNRIQKHQSFVYGKAEFVETGRGPGIEADILPRANGRAVCSVCERPRPGYDTLPARRFEFVRFWGFVVFFVYVMRRVECPTCGVRVEAVPWAKGKQRITTTYAWFLAKWAKRTTWTDVAKAFRTSWDTVFRSVEMAVEWGRANMELTGITSIGIDEISVRKGHRFLTLVYQIDE
ncbi:helix-turn-helix domain-containing protein, partial [Planctomycetota bacterium]